MTHPNYGIAKLQAAFKRANLPPQDQQNPVYNNNPNSSANNTYNYNPAANRAQEPIVTSTDGTQSSKPVQPQPDYESRVTRLQKLLNTATRPQTVPDADNRANLGIPEQLKYKPNNYEETVKFLQQQSDRDFNKAAAYSGISRLGAALSGANAEYQRWWG